MVRIQSGRAATPSGPPRRGRARRSSCRCTSACSATAIRSPSPGTATGTPGDWWTVFANSPDVLEHACRGFALYASPDRKVAARAARAGPDPRRLAGRQPVRVLAALQVVPRATASPRRRSRRSRRGSVSDLFSPLERALLAYTDALVLGFGRVDDAVFDALREHLSDEADPRVHLHHDDVHDARGHLGGAAPRVRRPRRSDRRDRRRRPTTSPRTSAARSGTTKATRTLATGARDGIARSRRRHAGPGRSPACVCSSSAASSPGRSPASCSATTAPTSSRSSRPARATRCAAGASRVDGDSLWWPAIARNKRSVALDLRDERGRDVVRRSSRRSATSCSRTSGPARSTSWGLDYDALAARQPAASCSCTSRASARPGRRAARPASAAIGEAMGGIRHTTGESRPSAGARRRQPRRRARRAVRA